MEKYSGGGLGRPRVRAFAVTRGLHVGKSVKFFDLVYQASWPAWRAYGEQPRGEEEERRRREKKKKKKKKKRKGTCSHTHSQMQR